MSMGAWRCTARCCCVGVPGKLCRCVAAATGAGGRQIRSLESFGALGATTHNPNALELESAGANIEALILSVMLRRR